MEEKSNKTLWIVVGVVILAILGYLMYLDLKSEEVETTTIVTNFEECVRAGFPITDGSPRECTTENGSVYKEEVLGAEDTAIATGGCFIGGCSSQICSDQPDVASTCEYRAEYGCYQSARCERQTNGSCGWTQTSALTQCLQLEFDINNLSK